MALNKRERNLAIAAGVLLVPFAVWLVVGAFGGSTTALRAANANHVNEINKAKKTIRVAREAQQKLDAWNRMSLPRDVEAAGSRYKIWLMELCESDRYGAKFQNAQVKPMKNQPISGVGQQLSFSVSGVASLEQLTRWLYGFYSADYLHQIKGLTITPLDESKKLNLSIQVEALALSSASDAEGKPRAQTLQEVPEDAINKELLDKYCNTISDRAVFSRYSPPPPGSTAGHAAGGTESPIIRSRQVHSHHRHHGGYRRTADRLDSPDDHGEGLPTLRGRVLRSRPREGQGRRHPGR